MQTLNHLHKIFNMIFSALMYHSLDLGKSKYYSLKKISVAHGFLVLQNFFAIHGRNITDS